MKTSLHLSVQASAKSDSRCPSPSTSRLTLHLLLATLSLTLLPSCKKETPSPTTQNTPTTNPTLAAAQLNLAQIHLNHKSPLQALPYLHASVTNHPLPETKRLFTETLASTKFTVPTLQLDHPYPVTDIAQTGNTLIAAIGGKYPTLIRWNLTSEPSVAAILFPIQAKKISHLILSPSGKHLLTQRDSTNLLCIAETLKPIASIGTFPDFLSPQSLQPFSENSLIFAHPTAFLQNTIAWHIRDTATGDTLRTEITAAYPRPVHARFSDTNLLISHEDGTLITIPIIGEIIKTKNHLQKPLPPTPQNITISASSITIETPLPASSSIPLDTLTGFRLDPTNQTLIPVPTSERLETLSSALPHIPKSPLLCSAKNQLEARLAAAYPNDFPDLTQASRKQADAIRASFASNDHKAILETITTLPPTGLHIATALYLACESNNPELIQAILNHAENVPPPIKQLALGKSELPDISHLRESQDWIGYESPDFISLFKKLKQQQTETLSSLTLTDSPDKTEIETLFNRLLDPEVQRKLGKAAISQAAATAALTLAATPEHAASSLHFAAICQRTGSHPSVILRIRATALSSLADYKNAHTIWIDLITNQPEATHLPTDYSQAAHTAFEVSNPDQAIEILNTGVFRFPRDVTLSLRAGQIAILTNHTEQAIRFLKLTTSLGIPPDEIENTTALLAIAHSQLGDQDTALAYLAQLEAIDNSWTDPAAIRKLPWPEPLLNTLQDLILSRSEILPEPLLENDPIDMVLPLEELPIPEPELPE